MAEEKIVVGAGTKYPLNGLLTIPEQAAGPVPAVVFVHGSGSSNMDEKVGKLTPFKDLAEGLAKHGIASVRYDKRSYAHGLKMVREKNLVITVKEETIEDAVLATELLKQDPRIDPERIFIVGHSMGAMLAPRIDAEGGNYRGLILMAGTPRTLEEVMVGQMEDIMAGSKGLMSKLLVRQLQKISRSFAGRALKHYLKERRNSLKKSGGSAVMAYPERRWCFRSGRMTNCMRFRREAEETG